MSCRPGIPYQPVLTGIATVLLMLPIAPFRQTLAQQTVIASTASSCPHCTVSLDHVARLGEHLQGPPLGTTYFVKRDSRGRLYTANSLDTAGVYVFDPTGRFIEAVGTKSEAGRASGFVDALVIAAGDTLRTFNSLTQEYTVISPVGEIVWTSPFKGDVVLNGYALLPGGSIALAAIMESPQTVGFPFHIANPRGEITSSFGPDLFVGVSQNLENTSRRVASDNNVGIWAAPSSKYILEHWNRQGEVDATLVRQTTWFRQAQEDLVATSLQEPPSTIRALNMDDEGNLWILIRIADRRWATGLKQLDSEVSSPIDFAVIFDTVIEVIDPAQGSLIASVRVDAFVAGFSDDDHVFSYRSRTRDQASTYDVWRMQLVQE